MIGEYVTCISVISNELIGYKYLTLGKKYRIVDIDNGTREYQIVNDIGDHSFYAIYMFRTTQELREETLNKLGI
jgi:hypothetical protein